MHFLFVFYVIITSINNSPLVAAATAGPLSSREAKEAYLRAVVKQLPNANLIKTTIPDPQQCVAVKYIIARYLCRNKTDWQLPALTIPEVQIKTLPRDVIFGLSYRTANEALQKAIDMNNNIGIEIATARGGTIIATPNARSKLKCPCNCTIQ